MVGNVHNTEIARMKFLCLVTSWRNTSLKITSKLKASNSSRLIEHVLCVMKVSQNALWTFSAIKYSRMTYEVRLQSSELTSFKFLEELCWCCHTWTGVGGLCAGLSCTFDFIPDFPEPRTRMSSTTIGRSAIVKPNSFKYLIQKTKHEETEDNIWSVKCLEVPFGEGCAEVS